MSYRSDQLIDYGRYPIAQEGTGRDVLLAKVRADLDRDGCAVINGFLTPEGITALAAEADGVADKGIAALTA